MMDSGEGLRVVNELVQLSCQPELTVNITISPENRLLPLATFDAREREAFSRGGRHTTLSTQA